MIENIAFTVRFPPTDHYPLGRAFDRNIDFQPGMTNIVGPNEAGKSLILEMVEFLLFGSKALRGKADDYKHLKVEGVVRIRGVQYHIVRTLKSAHLGGLPGEVRCTGTKPVNAQILQRLGYGLDVFRVANVANQGDAERLSKMLPAERRAMVDKLIGADQIEAIARWCGEEALGISREIAGLEAGLGPEPEKPVRPDDYRTAAEVQVELETARAQINRAVELRAFLANEPAMPDVGEPPTLIPLATLEKAEQILGLRTYDFDLAEAVAQQNAYDRWLMHKAFVGSNFPQPVLTQEQVDQQNLRNGLARDRQRLRQSPTILCPCGKPFTTADAEIARLDAAIEAIPQLEGYAQLDLDREQTALHRWKKGNPVATTWEDLKDVVEASPPEHDPSEAKGAVHVSEVTAALRDLAVTGSLAEVRALARELRAWQAEEAAGVRALERRKAWDVQAVSARSELFGISTTMVEVSELDGLLARVRLYEAQKAGYDRSFSAWAQGRDRLTDLNQELASWKNGRQAMNELRAETKTYIVPALSRVASFLLHEMTGGKRSRVVVDEDFEIEVDGQALNTLSGSGKVCANLAIRLALGRILTNGVFPVFMGDEMDASMDEDRADHLHTALVGMQQKLSQIMIITHKQPTCTQVVQLGD